MGLAGATELVDKIFPKDSVGYIIHDILIVVTNKQKARYLCVHITSSPIDDHFQWGNLLDLDSKRYPQNCHFYIEYYIIIYVILEQYEELIEKTKVKIRC